MPQQSLFSVQNGELRTGFSCVACSLHRVGSLRTNCMKGVGAARPKFLFVGKHPGMDDDGIGEPMTGPNGRLFRDLLRDAGYFEDEVYFTNCLKCAPYGETAGKTQWKACKQFFLAEVAKLDPEVIVAVGKDALKWLTGHSGITKLIGKPLPLEDIPGRVAYPLQQPASLFKKEGIEKFELRRKMVDDLRWLRASQQSGKVGRQERSDCDYRVCRSKEDVDWLFSQLESHDDFSFDFETQGLKPIPDKNILAVGFSWKERFGVALPLLARGITTLYWWDDGFVENYIVPRLRDILTRKKVFGHNAIQFDQQWARAKLQIQNLNIDFDTQICHYVLNEERGTHDLEQLAVLYTDMPPWKRMFTEDDTEQLCLYLCRDVDATFRLKGIFYPQLTDRQRWLFHELLIPLAKELFEVEYRGVKVSETNLLDVSNYLQSRIDAATHELRSDKYVRLFELAENVQINIDSPDQLRLLFEKYLKLPKIKETGKKLYCTDREVLEHYSEEPVAAAILQIRRLKKLKGTYCDQILRELRDGRIHTSYKVHGTVTGRPASSDPNLMNMPREDTAKRVLLEEDGKDGNEIKRIFVSEEDCCFIEADFSQAELRVLGSIANDKRLIGIYQRGEDVHTATAAEVYGIPLSQVTKAQRSLAKPVNFGIVYGMQLQGLIKKFESAGSTAHEAERFLNQHKKVFPDVWKYMDLQEVILRSTGYQETYFGRRRRYAEIDHEAIRQAYNFPIQSLASDLTLISLIRIAKALRQLGLKAYVTLTVYDSIVVECPLAIMWQVAKIIKHIMSSIHFEWMRVPMAADLKAGLTWGDLKEIDVENQTVVG